MILNEAFLDVFLPFIVLILILWMNLTGANWENGKAWGDSMEGWIWIHANLEPL